MSSSDSTPPDCVVEQTQEVSPVEEEVKEPPKKKRMLATYKLARAPAQAGAGSDAALAEVQPKKEEPKTVIDLTVDEEPKPEPPKQLFTTPEEDGPEEPEQTYTGWKPKLAPIAQPNYKHDPARQLTDLDDTWNYSPSMKGWIRMECIVCGKFVNKDEQHALTTFRSKVPHELRGDIGKFNRYKCRVAPVCFGCRSTLTRRLTANPQMYNGRGVCYYIVPY